MSKAGMHYIKTIELYTGQPFVGKDWFLFDTKKSSNFVLGVIRKQGSLIEVYLEPGKRAVMWHNTGIKTEVGRQLKMRESGFVKRLSERKHRRMESKNSL